MKTVAIQIGDEPTMRDLQIQPGTTVRDVLAALGLPDTYLISQAGRAMPFATDGEDLYSTVPDGAKLRAYVQGTVGNGINNG